MKSMPRISFCCLFVCFALSISHAQNSSLFDSTDSEQPQPPRLPSVETSSSPKTATKTTREPRLAQRDVEDKVTAKATAAVDRQMQTLQRRLEQEEKRLEKRLADLGNLRDKALEKNDEKELKKIEQMETAAVKDYENRLAQVLQAAAKTSTPKTPVQRATSTLGGSPKRSATANTQKPAKPTNNNPPQKRRLRLWPFGR